MKAKEKIIMVAEEIFADYEYRHATVKMICEQAKVNISSVNYHFRSKRDLYLEVLASIYSRVEDHLRDLYDFKTIEPNQEGWQRFISQAATTFVTTKNSADVKKWHKIIFRELNNPSEAFDDIYQLYMLPTLQQIDSNMQVFFPKMEQRQRFMWILTLISQACFIHSSHSLVEKYYGTAFYDSENIKQYAEHISKTIYNSISVEEN